MMTRVFSQCSVACLSTIVVALGAVIPSEGSCQTPAGNNAVSNSPEGIGSAPQPTVTPTFVPTSTPTRVPTVTPSASPTPVIVYTPTPTPTRVCEANTITIRHVFELDPRRQHGGALFTNRPGNPLDAINQFYQNSCIQQILSRCLIPRGVIPQSVGFEVMFDDCIFLELANRKMQADRPWLGATQCGSLTPRQWECMRNGGTYDSFRRCRFIDSNPVRPTCSNIPITLTLDNSCGVVRQPELAQICGHFDALAIYTPLSLLWRPGVNIDQVKSSVSFPLNPYEGAQWHDWKASADTPLVVWDPTFSGKITSGAQLFGDWTWGGQMTASIDARAAGTAGAKWDNGYHALQQLDRDSDKRVSGDELAGISLWFDRNQNGVSEEGEVVTAEKAGLTTLFVTPDSTDPVTKSIHATVGFERNEEGRVVSGASVDWFAEGADSKFDLVVRQQNRSAAERVDGEISAEASPKTDPIEAGKTLSTFTGKEISGVWLWTVKGDAPVKDSDLKGGLLVLTVNDDEGSVSGSSLAETPMKRYDGALQRVITRYQITGRVVGDGSGREIEFTTLSGGKLLARSSVKVLADGTLEGQTTPEGGTIGRYEWVASR